MTISRIFYTKRPICADVQGRRAPPPPPRRSSSTFFRAGGCADPLRGAALQSPRTTRRSSCLRPWHTVCRPSSGVSNTVDSSSQWVPYSSHAKTRGGHPRTATGFLQSHVTPPRITALRKRIVAAYRVHPAGSRNLCPGIPPAFVHLKDIPGTTSSSFYPGRWLFTGTTHEGTGMVALDGSSPARVPTAPWRTPPLSEPFLRRRCQASRTLWRRVPCQTPTLR